MHMSSLLRFNSVFCFQFFIANDHKTIYGEIPGLARHNGKIPGFKYQRGSQVQRQTRLHSKLEPRMGYTAKACLKNN